MGLDTIIRSTPIIYPLVYLPFTNFVFPQYIQLEVTTRCNLNCDHCIRTNDLRTDMSLTLFTKIISEITASTTFPRNILLQGLGEPLLNPSLPRLINIVKKMGHSVGFTSNLTTLTPRQMRTLIQAQLDVLMVSFDAGTKATYEKIRRGANFDGLLRNIRTATEVKKELGFTHPKIVLSVTIQRDNVHEVPQILRLADTLNVDAITFYRQIIPGRPYWQDDLNISSIWAKVPKGRIDIEASAIFTSNPINCQALTGCYITIDGDVLPCTCVTQMMSRNTVSQWTFGNLQDTPLSNIWFSPAYRQFRTRLVLRHPSQICDLCTWSRAR